MRKILITGYVLLALLTSSPATGSDPSSDTALARETGLASYYALRFHGRRTASGEIFDRNAMVAAHPRYPFGTRVRVTNPDNGHTVEVRINDRGPAKRVQRRGVIIDLSPTAASRLDIIDAGVAQVIVDVLEWGGPR